ncbi:radical SAM protein [Streptosporangium sp. NPDC000563]|uniref:radical SAM protein n=1 Tax=Streptosporangium sp. NPDC000563 TaxID=3154366 RepID=UPI00331728BD
MDLRYLAAEITGRCQLECTHCYAESGPSGTDGTMTVADWKRVIDEAVALGARQVQFIGGEPTQHRGLPELIRHTLAAGVDAEVFSNLVHLPDEVWEAISAPGAQLATSFYTDDPVEHMRITGRNTLPRTQANIMEALARSIPLRVTLVAMKAGQRITEAEALLRSLGVERIRTDRLRALGRPNPGGASVDELCGHCGQGRVAVSPAGDVWPCVMGRFLVTGNVLQQPLGDVLTGRAWQETLARVPRSGGKACAPECNPASDGGDCAPAQQVDGE